MDAFWGNGRSHALSGGHVTTLHHQHNHEVAELAVKTLSEVRVMKARRRRDLCSDVSRRIMMVALTLKVNNLCDNVVK